MTDGLRANDLVDDAAALGAELADLILAAVAARAAVPTVADYIATIAPAFSPGTAATYRPYLRLAITHLGDRRLSEVTVVDLQAVVADAGMRATRRRPTSVGRSSRESCVGALRALFARARAAGLIHTDPAALLTKPRRARSRRRALDDRELAELIDAVRATSNDPDLDLLLVRFHLESGARREGALNLRLRDIDTRRATVWLREKGDSEREQPISPSLIRLLDRHARTRGATDSNDPLLRTMAGRPITARRYDTLFSRARRCLPWSDRTPVSAHVLRHTAINAVGRYAGYPVAQAFAGHAPPSVTGRYMQATLEEVAATIAALTSETHPLAPPAQPARTRCRQQPTHPSQHAP